MTQGNKFQGKAKGLTLLAAIAAMALPFGSVKAQSIPQGRYDYQSEVEPTTQTPAQPSLEQDRNDLISARHRADALAAQRDQQQKLVDSLRNGGSAPAPAATAPADVKSLQQAFDAAKASADKIHADAVAKFEQGDAWKAQFAKFDQSRKDLKGPTDAVLNQLGQTQEFKDLVATARTAKEKADKLHADSSADPQAVKDADSAFMAADNRVQEAAEKALTADPRVADGRKLVDAAKQQLDGLRDKFEQDLINDPAFGQAVAEVKSRQQALDAASGQPSDPSVAGVNPPAGMTLADAQTRLDQLNRDLDQARQDVDTLTNAVRQDEAAIANGDPNAQQPPSQDPAAVDPGYAYGGYQPDYGYQVPAYATPIYGPAVAYGGFDYWSPGLYLGFSFGDYHYNHRRYDDWYGRWCRPYSYGYRNSYGYSNYAYNYGRNYNYGNYGRYNNAYNYGRTVNRNYYEGSRYGSISRGYVEGRSYAAVDRPSYSIRNNYGSYGSSYHGSAYGYGYSDPSAAYRERVQRRANTLSESSPPRYGGERQTVTRDDSAYRERTAQRSTENSRSVPRETPSYERSTRSAPTFERSARSESAEPQSRSERSTPSYQRSSESSGSSHSAGSGGSNSAGSRSGSGGGGGGSSHGGH